MRRIRPLAAALLALLAWPAAAEAFIFGPLGADYVRLMAGVGTDFEHDPMYIGEVGWLYLTDGGERAPSVGPVLGLAVNGDVQRLSIGPHVAFGPRIGPEFVYRRVDGDSQLGGALHLGLELPLIVVAAGVGGRLGVTDAGFFGELGLTFVLRIPAGPRVEEQLEYVNRAKYYPRCNHDAQCAFRDEVCHQGQCVECREDAHCVPSTWTCQSCAACRADGICSGPLVCSEGHCVAVAPR